MAEQPIQTLSEHLLRPQIYFTTMETRQALDIIFVSLRFDRIGIKSAFDFMKQLRAFFNRKYPVRDPDWVHDADVTRFNFFKKRGLSDSGETCPNEVPQSKYYFNNGQNFYWSDQTGLSITCEAGDIPGKM